MTEGHDCAVVGEMLLRRAFHLNAADPTLDAVDTLARMLDTPLVPTDEPGIDPADREAFEMVRDRVVKLLGQDLVDWVGELSPDNYRIDSFDPTSPAVRGVENFTVTLEAAQQWARAQHNQGTASQVSYVVVDLDAEQDIWQLNPIGSEARLEDNITVMNQPES